MPSESSSSTATGPRKSSTRNSIRQSLNFASVGKAFADVMNKETREKDNKEAEKSGKKAMKDPHRSSIGLKGLAPRPSLDTGSGRPSPPPAKRPRTPDSKTVTARRRSSLAPHHQHSASESGVGVAKSPDSATPQTGGAAVNRSSSLRPRIGNSSSGLPKYRPKSIIQGDANKKPDSSAATATRKRPSISDDDKDDSTKEQMKPDGGKTSRPISPLPHRAAFKVALTNIPPSSSPKPQLKPATPTSSARSSPTRLAKPKKAPTAEQRPPSSTPSSTPHTPKSSPTRSGLRPGSSRKGNATESSDDSSHPSHPGIHDSPLVRHVRQRSRTQTPTKQKETTLANMSHISEADSEDAEEQDVEMLLAPVASIGAPTPAMPRIQASRSTRQRLVPQTPSKPNLPHAREMLMPPDAESSPVRLRTTPVSDRSAPRGSIMSWEQFATEASRTLGEEEISTILSDIPAPFQPGPLSPMPTGEMLLPTVPESPCLSAMNSPSGYGGSISQVLLPAVTPSPAVPRGRFREFPADSSTTSAEAALVPLLRLQLSAAENTAKERLMQMQLLEEEVYNLKQAQNRDAQALTQQFSLLEEQMKGKLEAEVKSAEQVAMQVSSLEERLKKADKARQNAVEEAVEHTRKRLRSEMKANLKAQQRKWDATFVAVSARREWDCVKDQCEDDLEALQSDKELISFLLGELDLAQRLL